MNKILPYFIEKIDNYEILILFQINKFNKGYKWVNNHEIWNNEISVKYPFYISNLPFIKNYNHIFNLREKYNEWNNNIMFLDEDSNEFNISLLRKEKLEQIRTN